MAMVGVGVGVVRTTRTKRCKHCPGPRGRGTVGRRTMTARSSRALACCSIGCLQSKSGYREEARWSPICGCCTRSTGICCSMFGQPRWLRSSVGTPGRTILGSRTSSRQLLEWSCGNTPRRQVQRCHSTEYSNMCLAANRGQEPQLCPQACSRAPKQGVPHEVKWLNEASSLSARKTRLSWHQAP